VTGKTRVLKTIRGEKTDRIPWVPFVGCHAGALIGVSADDYLKSSDHMVQGIAEAVRRYKPDGLPVAFDLQVEAEAMGCHLVWARENPPAVVHHPLCNGSRLEDIKIPGPQTARLGVFLDAARRIRKAHPDIALYGLITGPFTLALHLLGTDIFMNMFDQPEYVNRLMQFCSDVCKSTAGYYIDAGCDIIAMVDPMTSQIGPDQFAQFVTPFAVAVFEHIRSRGALSSFFVCGHAQQNIPLMCQCKCDNISVDENIPLDFLRQECTKHGVSFGGNLQLTSVLLLGSPVDSQKNAIACIETGGDKGFILAPGCDLPYATPPVNIEAVTEIVLDPYKRDVVKSMACESADQERLDMNEYGQADKIIVDIITLDSEACAPCQYMVDAVRRVAPEFEGIVEWREHKIKYRESLVFMTSLMVRNVPTICIDGEIVFVSRIPPRDELLAAIQKRINEKFRLRIQQKKACLYILGHDCEQTEQLKENLKQAIMEMGIDVDSKTIKDEKTIHSYGLATGQLPAVVMAKYQVKSIRQVPQIVVIKEWLKEL
jgi:MtaA/CmuA family methyltransferase